MNAVTDRFNGGAATTLRLRVRAVRRAAEGILLFELAPQDGAALPPWTPGAHLHLHLQEGLVRAYSLCNTPQQRDCYLIAVKREPDSRGGSVFLHEQVQEGMTISASPPVNAFPLIADVRAPLLLAAELAMQGRRHRLHYFARSLAHAAFFHELAAGSQGMSLHLGLDGAETEHAIAAALAAAPRSSPLYVCGPSPFIDAARRHAQLAGWREQDIHFERFAAPAMPTADADPACPVQAPDSSFELVLQRSGLRCEVPPGQSIVAAAAQLGVVIGTSCGEGFCGSCESAVVEGQPLHRDSVLSATERASGRRILPCVSRCAGTRLVLDL